MSSPLHNQVEAAYAELSRQRAALAEVQTGLASTTSTVTSRNRAVSVTVDSRGAVTEIRFPTGAQRSMASAELGALLVETIEAARSEAMHRTVAAFDGLLPEGLPVAELLLGSGPGDDPVPDLSTLITEALRGTGGPEQRR
ncbi:DNA-binding protein YbaB [Catenuloplanes nepalensis]|uniref:DNA-binding protein YbaB n=1 Tax=Catenuloplanes nepalensis TaxID=587533 RepID=A0ABT9MMR5_9ACTN|nr:YbaB/EbfC family nucleoid-associated protein [Catenuloplanes nepalensis]MDP9792688.1 DNA-binding protein YbaB [Catenuloplanes nepalensis]